MDMMGHSAKKEGFYYAPPASATPTVINRNNVCKAVPGCSYDDASLVSKICKGQPTNKKNYPQGCPNLYNK